MNIYEGIKFPYTFFDTYCIRTPILSLDFYKTFTATSEILDFEFKKQLNNPLISEAIFLASPELYIQLIKWKKGEFNDVKKEKRIKLSLLKYITRMSTRCTPFGLFSTIGSGFIDNDTKIELFTKDEFQKKTHYDMHFLVNFSNYLKNKPHIKKQLLFYSNSSLYRIGNRYRYVEYYLENKKRVYTLESVTHSKYLEKIIINAKKGNTIDGFINILENENIERDDANSFISELIENQILVSDIEPTVSGRDFLENIKLKLSSILNVDKELEIINELQSFLKKVDLKIGNTLLEYQPIKEFISIIGDFYEEKYLLQTDTFSSFNKNTIDKNIIEKIKQGSIFLNKIGKQEKNQNLEQFKLAFVKRYERERVSLLQLLDVESGIGYIQNSNSLEDTPFLDDVIFPNESNEGFKNNIEDIAFKRILQKKIEECLKKNLNTITLKDADFPNLNSDWTHAPDTLSILTEIILDNGKEKVFMDYCSPHATKLLGRFGHGSVEIDKLLSNVVKKEEEMNSEYIIAEIIHLPESRIGNILRRPKLSDYEIQYLGKSNLSLEHQIALEDILVSVEDNTIILYSEKFKKRIKPKLSNAHDYSFNSLPVYHFLCDLQLQNELGFGFQWAKEFNLYSFLPRIEYKDCILSKARWNFNKEDIKSFLKCINDKNKLLFSIFKWRKKNNLPEIIQLIEGENTLVINLKNYSSICMFLETIKARDKFILEESMTLYESPVKNENELYSNQCIFSLYNHSKLEQ